METFFKSLKKREAGAGPGAGVALSCTVLVYCVLAFCPAERHAGQAHRQGKDRGRRGQAFCALEGEEEEGE